MRNALTIDVEDYFHVTAFEKCIARESWKTCTPRVEENTRATLDLLDEFSLKGTFFVLGWVAECFPKLVREICDRGHELACHGYGHQLIYAIGPDSFREDIRKSKTLLEDLGGRAVLGYRAPSYSITSKSMWALDILIEAGFTYDSSIFPVHHDIYGMPDAPRFPHTIHRDRGSIQEFPLTTLPIKVLGKEFRLPVAGGGYLRLLPVALLKHALIKINRQEKQPVVLYFHPWEIDPDQPKVPGAPLKSRFRHYVNLHKTRDKLRTLFAALPFGTMARCLEHATGQGGSEQPQS